MMNTKYLKIKSQVLAAALMVVVASTTLVSCMSTRGSSAGGEVTGVGGYAYAEPAPYGMVLIDR